MDAITGDSILGEEYIDNPYPNLSSECNVMAIRFTLPLPEKNHYPITLLSSA